MNYNLRLLPKENGNNALIVDSKNEILQFGNIRIINIIPMSNERSFAITTEDFYASERYNSDNSINPDIDVLFNQFRRRISQDEYIEDMNIELNIDPRREEINMKVITKDILADFNPHGVMVMGYPKKMAKYLPKKRLNDIPLSCKLQKNSNNHDDNPPSNIQQLAI